MVYPLTSTLEFMAKGSDLPVLSQFVSHCEVQMMFSPVTILSGELQF